MGPADRGAGVSWVLGTLMHIMVCPVKPADCNLRPIRQEPWWLGRHQTAQWSLIHAPNLFWTARRFSKTGTPALAAAQTWKSHGAGHRWQLVLTKHSPRRGKASLAWLPVDHGSIQTRQVSSVTNSRSTCFGRSSDILPAMFSDLTCTE